MALMYSFPNLYRMVLQTTYTLSALQTFVITCKHSNLEGWLKVRPLSPNPKVLIQ